MTHRRRTLNVVMNGALDGPSNQALDRRMLALAANRQLYNVLRLHRFTPTASVGRHQALARELRMGYCRDRGIPIVRRLSGGGALYLDENQIGFSLVTRDAVPWCHMPLAQLLPKLACAAARTLHALGIAAYGAPLNDVEVAGRKIGSVYAVRCAGNLLMHGTVLLDADIGTILAALKMPTEKLTAQGLVTARTRIATVTELRGGPLSTGEVESALICGFKDMLGMQARDCAVGDLTGPASAAEYESERRFAERIGWEADDGAIESVTKTQAGAMLRARAEFTRGGSMLRRVEFATDAHVEPADFLGELAEVLGDMPVALLERVIDFVPRAGAQSKPGRH